MSQVHVDRIEAALTIAVRYGQIEGDHRRAWTIDQMVRALTGCNIDPESDTAVSVSSDYSRFVADAKAGEDGPDTYGWDEGIAP